MTKEWQKKTVQFYSVILVLLSSMPFLHGKDFPVPLNFSGLEISFSVCMILCNIGTIVIARAAFRAIFKDEMIALWTTAIYVLSVYRIYIMNIALDIRGMLVMMVFPGIAAGIYRLCVERRKTERKILVSFFLCTFVWIILQKNVVAGFWNMETREMISGQRIQEKGLLLPQLAFHFWKFTGDQPGEGMQYSYPIGVGAILILGLLLFLILWFSGKFEWTSREKERSSAETETYKECFTETEENSLKKEETRFAKVAAVLALICLVCSLNSFPWDILQQKNSVLAYLIGSIQQPHVFLRYGTFFLVVVWGNILSLLKKKKNKYYYNLGILLLLAGMVTSSFFLMDHIGTYQKQYSVEAEQK